MLLHPWASKLATEKKRLHGETARFNSQFILLLIIKWYSRYVYCSFEVIKNRKSFLEK